MWTYSSSSQVNLGWLREGRLRSLRSLRGGVLIVAPGFRRSIPIGAGVGWTTVWKTDMDQPYHNHDVALVQQRGYKQKGKKEKDMAYWVQTTRRPLWADWDRTGRSQVGALQTQPVAQISRAKIFLERLCHLVASPLTNPKTLKGWKAHLRATPCPVRDTRLSSAEGNGTAHDSETHVSHI